MQTLSRYPVFAQTDSKDKLPPMKDEPNQAEIDAETARRLREAAEERRQQGKKASLVDQLRGGYAVNDPTCFCQCGKFCPAANACIPVRGEVHQPYWTLREVRTAKGRAWAGCLYDPQADRLLVHTLYGRVYPTPCEAADLVLAHALNTQMHPVRFDRNQFCTVDLSAIEQRLAQRLFDIGYGYFLTGDDGARRHPLIAAGYQAALTEAEAAIADKEPGFVWYVSTDPALVDNGRPALYSPKGSWS